MIFAGADDAFGSPNICLGWKVKKIEFYALLS